MADPQAVITVTELVALISAAIFGVGGKAGYDRLRGNGKGNGRSDRALIAALNQVTESFRILTRDNTSQHQVVAETVREAGQETRGVMTSLAKEISNLRVAVEALKK
jgi:hypothetical protein